MPRTCAGCGDVLAEGFSGELCRNCRTERVPAALGAEISDELGDNDLEEVGEEPAGYPFVTRLVGRRQLFERLEGRIAEVRTRGEMAFLCLTGAPGVGKTCVAGELATRAGANARVLSAVGGGPGAPPYAPFQRILQQRFGMGELESSRPSPPPDGARKGEPERESRERIRKLVAELVPESRALEVVHLIAQFLDVPFRDSPVVEPLAETPTRLEARTFIALKRFLAADAAKQPLVLIIDDVERASPETVNLIHYLAAGLTSSPLTLFCVGRPSLFDAHPSFGDGDVTMERIELQPLVDAESAELMRELLKPAGGDAPLELVRHGRDRLGGVPRAIVELVRFLAEAGLLAEDPNDKKHYTLDRVRLRALSLPDTLEGILEARLKAMPAAERDLLEKAAACGEVFWTDAVVALVRAAALHGAEAAEGPTLGEIAQAGDRARHEIDAAMAELARRGLVREQSHSSIPGERQYHFAYPPWWDVVYAGIDETARRRYHRLIAQWLELRPEGRGEDAQEEIGRHLERAGDGDGAALRYRRAGDAARTHFFNDKAIRLYAAAIDCLGPADLASRIHLWHDLGSVYQLKGAHDEALAAFERMLRMAWVVASRTKAAVAFNKMGRVYRQKGEMTIALEYLERGLQLFEQSGDTRGIAGSLDDIGQVLWMLARYDEALDRSAAALEARRRIGDKRSIATSLLNIGHIERHRGLFDEAAACYREALELRQSVGDRGGVAQVRNGLGVLAMQRGDIDAAKSQWEAALQVCESIGNLPLQAALLAHLGEAARAVGHRGEARTRFEAAETLAREVDDRRLLSETLRNLGLLDLSEGDSKQALKRTTQSLEIAEKGGIRVNVGRALLALGEVHGGTLFDDTGTNARKADDYFSRGVSLFRDIGNDAELGLGLERYGKYKIERGDVGGGMGLLNEAQDIFTRLGMKPEALRRLIGDLGE
jgi:tetratricopeptide (TPR) repeat protein